MRGNAVEDVESRHPSLVERIVFSPDGQRLFYVLDDGTIHVVHAEIDR